MDDNCFMDFCFNTKGFESAIKREFLPDENHLTFGGEFN
jgi:hypothetical protein